MSAATVLARGRVAAEALMVDACVVTHPTGGSTSDTTGVVTPTTTVAYSGKCRVQQRTSAPAGTDVAEADLQLLTIEVQVPITGTGGVVPGDRVTITAAALDSALVGRVFIVRGEAHKTHASARRLQCIEVTS